MRNKIYILYGDNTNKKYNKKDIKKYFKRLDNNNLLCIKNLIGDWEKSELYQFKKGDIVFIERTSDGYYQLRRN